MIISGEHFVVHGSVALAAAIGRKTRVEASRADGLVVETPVARSRAAPRPAAGREAHQGDVPRRGSQTPGVRVAITSELPTGAGLGSSSSTMVATAAAVSRLEGWNIDVASIIDTAMLGERLVHGKPSGIDVAVSALGGVPQFRVGEEPKRL